MASKDPAGPAVGSKSSETPSKSSETPPKPSEAPPPTSPPTAPGVPSALAAAAATPAPKPFLLPFELTVRDVRTTPIHIELDCGIVDGEGRSVQFLPLSVDIKTTTAEIEAILAKTIEQIAEGHFKRESAVLPAVTTVTNAVALKELVGRTYKGSVAR